jgi:hypothetical protein
MQGGGIDGDDDGGKSGIRKGNNDSKRGISKYKVDTDGNNDHNGGNDDGGKSCIRVWKGKGGNDDDNNSKCGMLSNCKGGNDVNDDDRNGDNNNVSKSGKRKERQGWH